MKYTDSFRSVLSLEDGTHVALRAIRPSDKAALAQGFARLSAESRRQRFNAAKSELTDEELHFLTECDGWSHYALVALIEGQGDVADQGVGVVRIIRSESDDSVAELGIAIADEWQGRGVGYALLEHIVAAAAEREIATIRAIAQADNGKILTLLEAATDELHIAEEDDLLIIEFPVPTSLTSDAFDQLLDHLRTLTFGTMILPLRFGDHIARRLTQIRRETVDRLSGQKAK